MTDTIHHLPGRLRVRMSALRRNPVAVDEACRAVEGRPGVLTVEANELTGSLLVIYDPKRIAGDELLDALSVQGFTPPRQHAGRMDYLADTVTSFVVDTLVERGASLLLASLI